MAPPPNAPRDPAAAVDRRLLERFRITADDDAPASAVTGLFHGAFADRLLAGERGIFGLSLAGDDLTVLRLQPGRGQVDYRRPRWVRAGCGGRAGASWRPSLRFPTPLPRALASGSLGQPDSLRSRGGGRVASAVTVCLAVAVGAKQLKILDPVVIALAVHVMELERQSLTLPVAERTLVAHVLL